MLSSEARNTAWVSFDGRKRQEICHGDRSVAEPVAVATGWIGSGVGDGGGHYLFVSPPHCPIPS